MCKDPRISCPKVLELFSWAREPLSRDPRFYHVRIKCSPSMGKCSVNKDPQLCRYTRANSEPRATPRLNPSEIKDVVCAVWQCVVIPCSKNLLYYEEEA